MHSLLPWHQQTSIALEAGSSRGEESRGLAKAERLRGNTRRDVKLGLRSAVLGERTVKSMHLSGILPDFSGKLMDLPVGAGCPAVGVTVRASKHGDRAAEMANRATKQPHRAVRPACFPVRPACFPARRGYFPARPAYFSARWGCFSARSGCSFARWGWSPPRAACSPVRRAYFPARPAVFPGG